MVRIGSTNRASGALRASLAGLGALATGAALAVAVSMGPAAAESATVVANVSVGTSASTADVLPGETLTVTVTVTEESGESAHDVAVWLTLPDGLTLTGPSGPAIVDLEPGGFATASFDTVVAASLPATVTELTIGVSTSTGASDSLTVTVLEQAAISVWDLGPAASSDS